jgi:uncharacterized membrane protein YqjE
MTTVLQKSRLLSTIVLERVGDYLDLLRIEIKIREHDLQVKLIGFAIAGLFALLVTIFFGLAVIVSFWDSPYRAAAAWFVVAFYAIIAGISVVICLRHVQPQSIASSLRTELQRDIVMLKESA